MKCKSSMVCFSRLAHNSYAFATLSAVRKPCFQLIKSFMNLIVYLCMKEFNLHYGNQLLENCG